MCNDRDCQAEGNKYKGFENFYKGQIVKQPEQLSVF